MEVAIGEKQALLDEEGAAYKAARDVFKGLEDAKKKRLEKEENERKQAELAEA